MQSYGGTAKALKIEIFTYISQILPIRQIESFSVERIVKKPTSIELSIYMLDSVHRCEKDPFIILFCQKWITFVVYRFYKSSQNPKSILQNNTEKSSLSS